ncbi:MAG: hypothetical protein SCARUB_05178 [Candidatus Scalindua rubra]|uniref:Class I SAM-dependent methyltransferase n=1 Tax=Candidatus Scalindua rubra TaxID=1872076 RepID=A0A1E3X271_9BACT|nr:MAG: hypothetical protein SCARUB_05178 [Candidatus Scalindua rubra]
MSSVKKIGNPPWTRSEIVASIDEFSSIYANRPIRNNRNGMKAPHMFAAWFMVRKLSPDLIVESGIWKGQSTWLLEQACPKAKIVSIDLNLGYRKYISDKVVYSDKDFCEQDWSEVTDHSLVFFDDHQNAYKRLQQCKWFGFKHIIFDDNYPITRGDCYSLKKAFANAGFEPAHAQQNFTSNGLVSRILRRIARLIGLSQISIAPQYEAMMIQPNNIDSRMMQKHLYVYYEFPPVFKTSKTRFGDEWNETSYSTPEPLLDRPIKSSHDIFLDEAKSYTWICYVKLK